MKIAILTVATNIHAFRWITALAERGLDIVVITQQPPEPGEYPPSVEFAVLPFHGRFAYALNALALRGILRRSGADLLHVHYAGGYGATVWLSGIRDSLISVWGGDVYDVPERSWLHRVLVSGALKRAGRITSTSHVMKAQVERLGISTPVDVIPFGVDTDLFRPRAPSAQGDRLVIGTVKTLSRKYGIDTLIRGFARALREPRFLALNPELRIAGGGPARGDYEQLVRELGVAGRVNFLGHVPHEEVPSVLAGFDIYAAISRDDSESFGVAIIEASACALPVVVSDAGGLPEVVDDGLSGLVVPRDNPTELATVLVRLALDGALRERLGRAGVDRVRRLYEWSDCVDSMLEVYNRMYDERTKADAPRKDSLGDHPDRRRKRARKLEERVAKPVGYL